MSDLIERLRRTAASKRPYTDKAHKLLEKEALDEIELLNRVIEVEALNYAMQHDEIARMSDALEAKDKEIDRLRGALEENTECCAQICSTLAHQCNITGREGVKRKAYVWAASCIRARKALEEGK
jgi:hypothetical protein